MRQNLLALNICAPGEFLPIRPSFLLDRPTSSALCTCDKPWIEIFSRYRQLLRSLFFIKRFTWETFPLEICFLLLTLRWSSQNPLPPNLEILERSTWIWLFKAFFHYLSVPPTSAHSGLAHFLSQKWGSLRNIYRN